jgi:DNA-binding CsgD family transcriptional regulator/uncharacterized protein YoaH (UPF0181 family)
MASRATTSTSTTRAVQRVGELCAAGLPAQELIAGVADEIRRTVSADSLFLTATDPDTMLGLGPGVVHDMPDTVCEPFWAFEFEVPDYNKFSDLAHGPRHAADLHAATGRRPQRSARWRELSGLMDAGAELRAAFMANGRGWGILHANRAGGSSGFSESEVAFVEAVTSLVGRGLREALISQPADGVVGRGPGMAIFDPENRLVSVTQEAVAWFDEIESIRRLPKLPDAGGVPSEVIVAAQEARARATDPSVPDAPTRTRARTRSGAWLLIHASCLRGAGGALGDTAVVLEPAKASEVAPLIVEAYELTAREVEVTRAVSRGLTTNEIARELHLSRYTVADHLKSVYEKAGVSGRGELVAKMFADHYHDRLAGAVHAIAA